MICPTPYQLAGTPEEPGQKVPCGQCGACRHNRRVEWSFRLKEELKHSETCYFITLTYAPEHLPHIDTDTRGTLVKQDLQKFIKRLRRRQERSSCTSPRYYGVGEYGSKLGRPHYHVIIFNASQDVIQDLPKLWKFGNTRADPISDARIHYVTKYHVNFDKKSHKNTREPEFALMSKKPGIGAKYIDRAKKWHQENQNLYVINNGYKQNIPRYFKDKIFTEDQIKEMSEKRLQDMSDRHWEELQRLEDLGITNPEQYIKQSRQQQANLIKKKGTEKDQM